MTDCRTVPTSTMRGTSFLAGVWHDPHFCHKTGGSKSSYAWTTLPPTQMLTPVHLGSSLGGGEGCCPVAPSGDDQTDPSSYESQPTRTYTQYVTNTWTKSSWGKMVQPAEKTNTRPDYFF
ncbi:unnamed protein product, partial [Ectocarpus sp. 8 AP-2014]